MKTFKQIVKLLKKEIARESKKIKELNPVFIVKKSFKVNK